MKMKSLFGLALLSSAVVLTGWGAAGIAGWTAGQPDLRDEPRPSAAAGTPVVTGAINVSLTEPEREPAPVQHDRSLNALLFSPHFIAPPPPPAEPGPETSPGLPGADASPAVGAVPQPPPAPPRQRSGAIGAATEKSTANRAQRPPRDNFQGTFTAAHIARIKQRLNLTADQEEHWRPVEAALQRIAQRQARGGSIMLNATESQDLYWAAGPLIMSLRPDQKEAARSLARSMGLETVASLI
jgi:hypothetical protein